jgi:hypothetical protein
VLTVSESILIRFPVNLKVPKNSREIRVIKKIADTPVRKIITMKIHTITQTSTTQLINAYRPDMKISLTPLFTASEIS